MVGSTPATTAPAPVDPVADVMDAARNAAVREAAEEAGLVVDPEGLVVYAHWSPPKIAPKRFATWFFVAPAPAGDVVVDGGEIHEHAWVRPADGLARRDAGEIELAPPTWVTLHDLARFATVDDALATISRREPEFFETRIATVDDAIVAMWHGDAGYDSGDADATGPRTGSSWPTTAGPTSEASEQIGCRPATHGGGRRGVLRHVAVIVTGASSTV